MTDKQYQQLLRNRRPARAEEVSESRGTGQLLRLAAERLHQREHARRALERLLQPSWLAVLDVVGIAEATLVVATSDLMVYEQLRRRRAQLQRELARQLPAIRRLRVLPGTAELPKAN